MQELIPWSDKLSVSVNSVDEQHKELVRMLNELNAALDSGQAGTVIGRILRGLIHYTASHFAHEEDLMRRQGYPGYQKHRKEHQRLVARVFDLQAQFDTGRADINTEVLNFLKQWLTEHIQGSDKEMGMYLSANKVA